MSAAASTNYALTPGHLNPDDPIDLNDKLDRDIYNRAVEPMFPVLTRRYVFLRKY